MDNYKKCPNCITYAFYEYFDNCYFFIMNKAFKKHTLNPQSKETMCKKYLN